MPTPTFYHLPQEKRQRLTQAIERELIRVPFEELSINRIVQDAGIPRGSYYQYFTDRYDMRAYMMEKLRDDLLCVLHDELYAYPGDPFEAMPCIMEKVLHNRLDTDCGLYCRHLIANMKVMEMRDYGGRPNDMAAVLKAYLRDKNCLPADPQQGEDLVDILLILFRWTMAEASNHEDKEEEILESFRRKLIWVQRGMQNLDVTVK